MGAQSTAIKLGNEQLKLTKSREQLQTYFVHDIIIIILEIVVVRRETIVNNIIVNFRENKPLVIVLS